MPRSARCTPPGVTIVPPRTIKSSLLVVEPDVLIGLPTKPDGDIGLHLLCDTLQKTHRHSQGHVEIRWRRILVRMMAETVAAADEEHRDRRERGHHHRIVAGSAHQLD